MRKKDTLKMIDEEEAVISINELLAREKAKEKLYNMVSEYLYTRKIKPNIFCVNLEKSNII